MEARKAAEEALIKLGPRVLPLLPEADEGGRRRAQAAARPGPRGAPRGRRTQTNLGASKVTIQAKGMRLSEVVQKLQAQSGNAITDLREAEGAEAANPSLDLDIDDKPFLEALDIVGKQAEITPNFFTGDGTIGLMAGEARPTKRPLVLYTGPFRVAFKQIGIVRDLQAGTAHGQRPVRGGLGAAAPARCSWRSRPTRLKIVDDQGKDDRGRGDGRVDRRRPPPREPGRRDEPEPHRPRPRGQEARESLKVKAEVTVPAGLEDVPVPDPRREGRRPRSSRATSA